MDESTHICICFACKKVATLKRGQFLPPKWSFEARNFPAQDQKIPYDDFNTTCIVSYYCEDCALIKDILE